MAYLIDTDDNLEGKTDEEIVKLALEDQNAFVYIVRRYKQKLLSYIKRISNVDIEEAEDVLQETFLKVYLNLNDFDQDLKFSSWIYRITHNQVISHYRKKQARPQRADVDLFDDRILSIASEFRVEKDLDQKILKDNIVKILDNLDIKFRDILVLKYLEEKDYQEISDIIKKPVGTVASRLSKAKQSFKKEMEKQNLKI